VYYIIFLVWSVETAGSDSFTTWNSSSLFNVSSFCLYAIWPWILTSVPFQFWCSYICVCVCVCVCVSLSLSLSLSLCVCLSLPYCYGCLVCFIWYSHKEPQKMKCFYTNSKHRPGQRHMYTPHAYTIGSHPFKSCFILCHFSESVFKTE
jgi:hypothetical protein